MPVNMNRFHEAAEFLLQLHQYASITAQLQSLHLFYLQRLF